MYCTLGQYVNKILISPRPLSVLSYASHDIHTTKTTQSVTQHSKIIILFTQSAKLDKNTKVRAFST